MIDSSEKKFFVDLLIEDFKNHVYINSLEKNGVELTNVISVSEIVFKRLLEITLHEEEYINYKGDFEKFEQTDVISLEESTWAKYSLSTIEGFEYDWYRFKNNLINNEGYDFEKTIIKTYGLVNYNKTETDKNFNKEYSKKVLRNKIKQYIEKMFFDSMLMKEAFLKEIKNKAYSQVSKN
jgi:hypothetical protein